MPQEPPDETGYLVLADGQANQGIFLVTPAFFKETHVAGQEGWTIQLLQEGEDLLFILHSLPPNILTDLADTYPPTP